MITDIVSKTNIDSANLVKSRYNDVIIPASGETAIDISTARCVQYNDVLLGGDLNIIRLNDGNDGSFFSYQLNGVRKRDIAKVAQGVSVVHLYGENLKAIKVNSPELAEQNKISSLLCLIDQRISTQNKIIDKLQSLIKGIYSFVFKNNTYKECFLLGDIANLYQPQTIASTELNENGKYIVYGANGIIGRYDYYNHERPQIIITCRGNTCGTVNFTSDHCWITGNSMVINMEQFVSTVYQKYLLHYLNSLDYSSVISGSGQPQIVRESLKKVKVYLPSLLEQTEVANSIDKVLAKFSLEQRLLDGLVTQKRYLLQQMFI